jgi:hypothetical protein
MDIGIIITVTTNSVLIPLVIYGIKKFKKNLELQINTSRDIRDLTTYTVAICNELKIPCTLEKR